ncbi:nucleoside deaminase [Nodosilinea nodulosa]|uniref:nucleoside deaminase n=1 Tax=Nodosilinea nodulosa TaxID=416001 RepID=UPI001CED0ACD|nr:nucleoside deaminase [Nodosilinea nodulosa]
MPAAPIVKPIDSPMNPEAFMQLAIEEARKSKTPFGAVIVKDKQVVERSGNTVHTDNDPTCHAEVNAIRRLTQRLGEAAPDEKYTLYSTCEPCAMCAATCFWASISDIVYGVGVDDFADSNPNMIAIRCEDVFKQSPGSYSIKTGLLRDECRQLHEEFPL